MTLHASCYNDHKDLMNDNNIIAYVGLGYFTIIPLFLLSITFINFWYAIFFNDCCAQYRLFY